MKLLVVNCGSSSIKYQLFEMPRAAVLAKGVVERIGEQRSKLTHEVGAQSWSDELAVPDHETGMALIQRTLVAGPHKVLDEIGAVGHRVVHGGEEFSSSILIDAEVIDTIERTADLAPLHNPPNLAGIRAARRVLPGIPHVAVFDTAEHYLGPVGAFPARRALAAGLVSEEPRQPVDGAHVGTSLTRDFLLVQSAEVDKSAKPLGYEDLVEISAEAAGSSHPALFSMQRITDAKRPSMRHNEEHDWWILGFEGKTKDGQTLPAEVIIAGVAAE